MSSRYTHVITKGRLAFLMAKPTSFYQYTPLSFIHLYVDGHLSCFHVLSILNTAAMDSNG